MVVVPELATAGESMLTGKGDGVKGSPGGKNTRSKSTSSKSSQANGRKLMDGHKLSDSESQKLEVGMDVVRLNAIGTAARVLHLMQSMQVIPGRVLCSLASVIRHIPLLKC